MVLVTWRDGVVVMATLTCVLAYQNAWKARAKWKGWHYRLQNPLQPSQPVDSTHDNNQVIDCDTNAIPRRIMKAETVLSRRTSRIVLVLESSCDMFNQQAVLRTAECMGIQHVFIVEPLMYKEQSGRRISRQATEWLTIRRFKTSEACVKALLEMGYEIWATDLSQQAVSLESSTLQVPERLAIVMGRETDGVSKIMLEAASKRVYLPIHGFADSLNLNVATGMVILQLFHMCPEAKGAMTASERQQLRELWYPRLVKGEQKAEELLRNPPKPFKDLRRPDEHRDAWMGHRVKKKLSILATQLKQQEQQEAQQ